MKSETESLLAMYLSGFRLFSDQTEIRYPGKIKAGMEY